MENIKQEREETFADVVIDISHEALDKVFAYRVPPALCGKIAPGTKVLVPFGNGNRTREGYVVALKSTPDYDREKIKPIAGIAEGSYAVESQLIAVAAFIRETYGSSMIRALRTVLPVRNRMAEKKEVSVVLAIGGEEREALRRRWERRRCTARLRLLDRLEQKGKLSKDEAVKSCRVPLKELRRLEEEGIVRLETRHAYRLPFSGLVKKEGHLPLNAAQQAIADAFCRDYEGGKRATYLLYGVTGSGKTEVYLALIEEVLSLGRQAIVLIPEISLTYQTVRRFYERFGDRIAVLNSRLSGGERSDAVARIEAGEADVVIGPRSALFAPLKHLGLIIIDEEHDGAYKSDAVPKYHARETAICRAKLAGASVVLGSATPSVESYQKAEAGEYVLWRLPGRANRGALPATSVVDLRKEFQSHNRSIFSRELTEKMRVRLERKEQIMLFLNRRGFAGFVSCRACGAVIKCPHCDVSLTYHRGGSLRCHYCGYETAYVRQCPVCKSPHVAAFGLGTEKVEAALLSQFPDARVLRMDADTTKRKNAHQEILAAFRNGEADILLGTQMIVKGHDYPNVTLVGILAADLSLHGSDFRSGERTFQLLCQAAGRAGRGGKPGEVVIQTYSPDHYAIVTAAEQSYEHFYAEESRFRRLMGYPPYAHLLALLVSSGDEGQAVLAVQRIYKMIQKNQETEAEPIRILNPGQASIAKIRDVYRQVLYLKHRDAAALLRLKGRLEPVLQTHPLFAGVQTAFDFDPMSSY